MSTSRARPRVRPPCPSPRPATPPAPLHSPSTPAASPSTTTRATTPPQPSTAPSSTTVYTAVYDPTNNNLVNINIPLNPGISNYNVPITSSNTAVGTIVTSPVVFHAGDSNQAFTFKPASTGTTDILLGTPPAPFIPATQYNKRTVTVTTPAITANSIYTGVSLVNGLGIFLPVAPPSPVTVTVTTNGPAIATISNSQTVVGTNTVTFTNVTSTYVGAIYVQGISANSTTLTTTATGYTSGTTAVTVYPTGFIINPYSGNFSLNTTDSAPNVYVYTAILNPTDHSEYSYGLPLSPGVASVSVPFTSSSTSIGTLTPTSLVFNPGDTAHYTTFQPSAAGTTTLALGTVPGYTTPSNYQSITATVTNPNRTISANGPVTTGVNLETSFGIYLSTAPASPLTVTVTTSAPLVASLSNAASTIGTTSTTFTVPTNTTYVGTVYVQGLSQGSATITATATGYTSGSTTATVDPSGFTYSYYGGYGGNLSTTTFSSPSSFTYYPTILDPSSLAVINYPLTLNPGAASVSIPVTSSATQVGTITTSPIFFNPGDSQKTTNFQPVAAGTSTVSIGTPAGYSTPANYTSTSVTVTAPAISVGNVETGVNLGNTVYISLPQTPPNPVTITVTTNGPGIATIAKNATDVGTTTLTFPNTTSTNGFYIYVQGQSLGATTLTVSAPGYTNGNSTVTVDPAGFTYYYYNSGFTTSTTSSPSNITVTPCSLTPGTLTLQSCFLYVNPGLGTVAVPVANSSPSVGTSTSPVNFAPGSTSNYTTFTPLATGTTVLTLGTPNGLQHAFAVQPDTRPRCNSDSHQPHDDPARHTAPPPRANRACFAILLLMGTWNTFAALLITSAVIQSAPAQATTPVSLPVLVADFNHDGIPDVLAISTTSPTATIAFGSVPFGTFSPSVKVVSFPSPCTSLSSSVSLSSPVTIADFNGDGLPDLLFRCRTQASPNVDRFSGVMLGQGDGTFAAPVQLPATFASVQIVGDFNHDGKMDVVVIGTATGTSLTQIGILLFSGNGDGTFAAPIVTTFGSSTTFNLGAVVPSAVVTDFNGDGYQDIVAEVFNGQPGASLSVTAAVFGNNRDGTFGMVTQGTTLPNAIAAVGMTPTVSAFSLLSGNVYGSGLPRYSAGRYWNLTRSLCFCQYQYG